MRIFSILKIVAAVLLLTSVAILPQTDGDKPAAAKQIKPALLVIDIQNAFLPHMSESDTKLGMEMVNGAIWLFREYKLPIIRIYHTNPGYGPKPGTDSFEFPKSVLINESDPKVIKTFPNAFIKTDLDKILKEKDVNTVFLCGLSATGCVLATYFGAQEREYKVFMIKDAIMSNESEYTHVIENISETITFETMMFILDHIK